jgi:hypothetical protein
MKKILGFILVNAIAGGAAAFASIPVGDGAELFLTADAGIRFDDNVLLSGNKTDDTIFSVSPGADLVFGKGAATSGNVTVFETFDRYSDNSRLNTDLFNAAFNSGYNDEKLKLNVQAGYHEVAQNTVDIRANFLVRRNVATVGADTEVKISPKDAIGVAVNYEDTDYRVVGYDDTQILTVPLKLYYQYTPKVDLSAGFSYRNTELVAGRDSKDYFYNIGARGEFTPKLTGRVNVGYNQRKLRGLAKQDQLGIDSSLAFAYSPKTNVQFGVNNDFGTSGQGESQKNFSVNAGAQSKIADDWSVTGNLVYRTIKTARTDHYVEGQAGVSYIVNAMFTVNAGYVYRDNNSDSSGGDFNNNVFSVGAHFRY